MTAALINLSLNDFLLQAIGVVMIVLAMCFKVKDDNASRYDV